MLKKIYNQLFSRSSISFDILLTGGSNITIVLLTFLSYGLVARIYSDADLSEYMINRRLAMTILPFIIISMPGALCRYLPLTRNNPSRKLNYTFITSAFVLLNTVLFSAIILLNHTWFSKLFYNKVISVNDISGLIMLCFGGMIIEHFMAYFRGMLWIKISNLLLVLSSGIFPLIVILIFFRTPIYNLIFYTGLVRALISLLFVILIIRDLIQTQIPFNQWVRFNEEFKKDTIEIVKYCVSRVPGILFMSLIWIIGPIMIVHWDKMAKTSIILAGLQFLSLGTIPMRPISSVFIPLFSEYKSQNKLKEISVLSSLVSSMALIVGTYFTLHIIVLAPVILDLWLNIRGIEAIIAVSIILLSMAPYLSFQININIIDTCLDRPYASYITSISLVVMLIVPFILISFHIPAIYAVSIGTLIAFIILGLTSEFVMHRLIIQKQLIDNLNRNYKMNFIYIFLSAGLIKLVHLLISHLNVFIVLSILLLIEVLILYFFIWINIRLKTTWVEHVVAKLKIKALF